MKGDTKSMRYMFVALAAVVGLLLLLLIFYTIRTSVPTIKREGTYVDANRYQAVFLNNNQVYFGKVTALNSQYMVISDVFYLQVNQTVQPNQGSSASANNNNNLVLQKLGKTELHKPDDTMVINRAQVTFWENITNDSQVVTAINKYKQNPNATTTPTTGNTSTTNKNQ